jgi:hypothetical protein
MIKPFSVRNNKRRRNFQLPVLTACQPCAQETDGRLSVQISDTEIAS